MAERQGKLAGLKKDLSVGRVVRFVGVGVVVTLIDFAIYTLANQLMEGMALARVFASVIAGVVATFCAYVLHSKITWKARDPGKYGILKFFIWNGVMTMAVRPFLIWAFGMLVGIYQFMFWALGWLFSYDFVEDTGVYALMTVVTMTLNFVFYDMFIFGWKGHKENQASGERGE